MFLSGVTRLELLAGDAVLSTVEAVAGPLRFMPTKTPAAPLAAASSYLYV